MPAKTYNAKKVIITYNGIPITGFADGTFLTITPARERSTKKVGADGEVARSKSNDHTHEVTFTLLQTSASNNYLSNLLEVDRLTDVGAYPLQVVDLSGTTLHFWDAAWIKQEADGEFANEISDRAWVLDTGQVAANVTGGQIV